MSKQLRRVLLEIRDQRLLGAYAKGRPGIADEQVFPSKAGTVLDPDNLNHYYFQPALTKAGLRKFRFHDLRHTFGSLLIQDGASLAYVKEQMGHSSIQVTADVCGRSEYSVGRPSRPRNHSSTKRNQAPKRVRLRRSRLRGNCLNLRTISMVSAEGIEPSTY